MAERSKERVWDRLLAGVAVSKPTWCMDACVLCCKWRQKAKLRRKSRQRNKCGWSSKYKRIQEKIPPRHECLLWVLCVVRYSSLRRADHSSRGVLPSVVCHCVWCRNIKNETALARVGLLLQGKKKVIMLAIVTDSISPNFSSVLIICRHNSYQDNYSDISGM